MGEAVDPNLSSIRLVLSRTPGTLTVWLHGLPDAITRRNEGPETWSAFDVVGHLIHGDRADWIPRAQCILEHGLERAFEPFDRFAQFEASAGRSLDELLVEFAALREKNLAALDGLRLSAEQLKLPGKHPHFGGVTLGQLLATWAVHDLGHLAQIARVMAKSYAFDVGPWEAYLSILGTKTG